MKPLSILSLLVGLFAFGVSPTVSAWVKNISLERVFVGDQTRVLQVDVRCRLDNKKRALRKVVTADSQWCAVDLPALCAKRKLVAARQLCDSTSSEYLELVRQAQDPNSAVEPEVAMSNKSPTNGGVQNNIDSRAELLEEKLLIEERRILLEARRLELRRLEISLKKELSNLSQASLTGVY